ncbi:MAG: Mrp/NBP35 family ATP-binding protein [Candidatus Omnitrophota bacterium]
MAIEKQKILEILSNVTDPSLPKDIVSLGMVREVGAEGKEIFVHLEGARAGVGAMNNIKAQIQELLSDLPGVCAIQVQVSSPAADAGETASPKTVPGVGRILAVASGKGGVGKSTATVNLAAALVRMGRRVGLLDADIYGPNIPLMLGIPADKKPSATEDEKIRPIDACGMKVMSMGLLVAPDQPMIWRGPMLHGAVSQFLYQVLWGELDDLLIDLPPGTGDVQLSLAQLASLAGAVIVTTPQEVALLDVRKAVGMFEKTGVPILGVIENMAGDIFGSGGGEKAAKDFGVPFLGRIPLEAAVRVSGDHGEPIVIANPQSKAALAFLEAAQRITEA